MPTVNPSVHSVTRRDGLTLLIVAFIAAVARLSAPGIVEFKLDEAQVSIMALDMVTTGDVPLTGIQSSVGVPNPPISIYLMAIPYALTTDPVVATMFVAALNVAGVALLWLIAYRYFGPTVALAAGLAYALNPWAVLYSRKIWAQDMHTLFVLLALLLGLMGFVEGKRWAQALCLPVLVLALQIHFAAWALLPIYLWLLWMGRTRLSGRSLAVSVVLTALTLLPFGVGLARTLQADPNRISNAMGRTGDLTLSADALINYAQFATGLGLETQVAPEQTGDFLASVPPQPQLWALLGLLVLAGLAVIWTRRYRPLAAVIVLWAGLPLLLFMVRWTPVYPHYFIASIPALCLLTGVALAWITKHLPGQPVSRTVLLTAFAAILLSQAVWWRGLLRYVETTPTPFGFGIPLASRMPLRDALLPYHDVVLLEDDARLDYSQEPAIGSALLYDQNGDRNRCVRALDAPDLLVLPARPFAVAASWDARDDLIAIYAHGNAHVFELPPDDALYTVYPTDAAPALPALTNIDARYANGAQLTGYDLTANGIDLEWRTPAPLDGDYHYFVHLLDANGERIAQRDAPFLPGRYTCADDRVRTHSALNVPENAATLRVGLYRLEGERFINSDALDEAGNAIAPWFDIALENE